jgi:predicted metal-binding protein
MTELIICTTCRTADTPRDQKAAGEILFETVQAEQAFGDRSEWGHVQVRGTACTAGCSRACTVAFQAPGKHSYQFGDLRPGDASARQLLDCAVLHHQSPDGNLARDARPPLLRNGILCRLPPYQLSAGTTHGTDR